MTEMIFLDTLLIVSIFSLGGTIFIFRQNLKKKIQNFIFKFKKRTSREEEGETDFSLFCPYCDAKLQRFASYCPKCANDILQDRFTIYNFLSENSSLFTIIGVIGTFTALLPSVATIYYHADDVTTIPFPQNFFLLSSVVLSSLLIMVVIALLIVKSLQYRQEEPSLTVLQTKWKYHIRSGDLERVLFYFAFIIPLFIIVTFLTNIFPNLFNKYFFIFLTFWLFVLFYFFSKIYERSGFFKSIWVIVALSMAIIFIIFVFALIYDVSPKQTPEIDSSIVYIGSDTQYYTPSLPQSVGIGLSPTNISGKNVGNVDFYWSTTFGYFVDWIPAEDRVILLGNSTRHDSSKIFWTYNAESAEGERNPIVIHLSLKKKDSSEILVNRSLNVTWMANDVLKVCN